MVKKGFSVFADEQFMERTKEFAENNGMSTSSFIRFSIISKINSMESDTDEGD